MPSGPSVRAPTLLLAWVMVELSLWAYLVLDGVSTLSRITLIGGFLVVFMTLLRRPSPRLRPISWGALEAGFVVLIGLEIVPRLLGPYRHDGPPAEPTQIWLLVPGVLAIVGLGLVALGRRSMGWLAGAGVTLAGGMAIAARVLIVGFDVEPTFDVHLIQEAAGDALLAGQNPYLTHVYYAGYPYWPLSAVVAALGQLVGDARWSLVVADAAIPFVLALVARNMGLPARVGALAGVLYLWSASGLYVIWQGLPEPALIAFVCVAIAFATSPRVRMAGASVAGGSRANLAGAALGLAIGVKQLALGLLPMLLITRSRDLRHTFLAAAVTSGAIVLAFLALDPEAFIRGSVLSHLVEPAREYAVNLLDPLPGIVPRFTVPFVITAALALTLGTAVRLRWPDNVAGWLAGSVGVLMVVFGLTGISFVNYYQIPLTLLLALTLLPTGEEAPAVAAAAKPTEKFVG